MARAGGAESHSAIFKKSFFRLYPEKARMKFVPLLAVADYRMEVGLTATLHSALRNLGKGYGLDIQVLSGAIGRRTFKEIRNSLTKIEKPFRLSATPISDRQFKGFRAFANTSLFTYARFLFQDMFPDLGKVIYLDVDTLVLGDLAELYKTPLEGKCVAAAVGRSTDRADHPWGILNYKELGIPPETPYFNAGVMVMDLEAWREEKLAQKCMEYAANHSDLCIFWDQTVMNTLLAGNFVSLEGKWNQQFNGPDKFYSKEGILHFCGPDKPWNHGNLLPEDLKDLFFDELDRTALKGWRPRVKISFIERARRKFKKMLYGF